MLSLNVPVENYSTVAEQIKNSINVKHITGRLKFGALINYKDENEPGLGMGIITDNEHTRARILEIRADRLQNELEKGKIVIVAGFQGVSINKEITTLFDPRLHINKTRPYGWLSYCRGSEIFTIE